jgi:hypothetical protein
VSPYGQPFELLADDVRTLAFESAKHTAQLSQR